MQKNEVKKEPLLEVKHLKKYFPLQTNIFGKPKFYLRAVDDVTFSLEPGKTIGVVGESGCGKTTLGRTILQLYELTGGKAIYYGQTIDDFLPKYYLRSINVLPQYKVKFETLSLKCEELKNTYNVLCTEVSSQSESKSVLANNKLTFTISSFEDLTAISNELKGLFVTDKSIELTDLDKQKLICLKALVKVLNEMHQALEYISSTTGGLILSHHMEEVKNNLLTKLLNEKKLKKLEKARLKYNAKLEILKEKDVDEDKVSKCKSKLEDIENQMNEASTLAKEASKNLGKLKEEIEVTDLYKSLENNREKGLDLSRLSKGDLRLLRTEIQLIFQDPYSSLPPRMTVGAIISEAVKVHNIVPKEKIKEHVRDIMKKCGLQPQYYDRYPHEFSGGQRQRICIARALAVNPKLVVCDEPVSALDVSIQAQIINLLKDLQRDLGLTYIFISHDLSVVKYITDNILVMYLGNMMEIGDTKDIFKNPLHPYTQALFSAVPIPNPDAKMNRIILKGDIPSPANPPKGCKFHTRCEKCMGVCKILAPKFIEKEDNHYVACHLYDEEVMAKLDEYDKEVERLEQEEAEKERLKNEQQSQNPFKKLFKKNNE